MHFVNLPNSKLNLSRVGYGGEQLGMHNWGKIDESDLKNSIFSALDHGINYFDTADIYGLGLAEINLSKFLGSFLNKVHIITKFGVRVNGSVKSYDNSIQWIDKALNASLKRLRREYIDCYQLHYWDGKTSLDDIVSLLNKFKDQGKIGNFGFSNVCSQAISNYKKFLNNTDFFSYEFSLANPENEHKVSNLRDKLFIAYGCLGQGILSGKYNANTLYGKNDRRSSKRYVNFHGDKLKRNMAIVESIKEIGQKYNVTPSAIALRYVLDYFPNSSIICGMKNEKQVMENTSIFDFALDEIDINNLTKISHE